VRFDMFRDYPPVVIWPEGDEVLGTTADGPALVSVEHPDQSRPVDVPADYQLFTPSAIWDRDGTHVIVSAVHHGTPQCGDSPWPLPQHACSGGLLLWQTLLIDRRSGDVTPLAGVTRSSSFAWSPDGSMFLVAGARERPEDGAELAVYSREGKLVWSQARPAIFSNASWSPDGSSIAMQILSKPQMIASAMRLDVLDAANGATRYRIVGAIACEGRIWTADSARLILLGAYGFERSVVADPRNGTLRALSTQLSPSVTEPNIAYEGSASAGPTAVNIDNGDTRQVASFSSTMASSTLSESPLFAFAATIAGGRGGCAEAIDPASPPTTHFEYPPFLD
jgi:hypothetical protein